MSLKKEIETKEKKTAVAEDKKASKVELSEAKAEAKSESNKAAVAKSFAKLDPKERAELHAELREAVAKDNDLLSQGKDPGSDHYNNLYA